MDIKKAQTLVYDHLKKIGYTDIETSSAHAFLHLIEEIGELSRSLLHKDTNRDSLPYTTEPSNVEDEIADVFWQTLKLASYLDVDLEQCFINKFEKNKLKSVNKSEV